MQPTHLTHARQATWPKRAPSPARGLLVVVIAVGGLAACGNDDDSDDAADAAASATVADAAEVASGAGAAAEAGPVDATPIEMGTVGKQVIVEMHVVLASDDIERSVASITAAASTAGGGVASSDIDYDDAGDGEGGHAVLVVKVPPAEVDGLLDGLAATGTVTSINQSAQDVADQLVDLDVRIDNARESVANVREFMDQTENLTELVTLEAELTRRQTELEQLEAQRRNLGDRVAMATITVEVIPRAVADEPLADRGLGDALADGWGAFVSIGFVALYVLAVLAPFIALAALVLLVVWGISRRITKRPVAQPPQARFPDPQPASPPDAEPAEPVGAARND